MSCINHKPSNSSMINLIEDIDKIIDYFNAGCFTQGENFKLETSSYSTLSTYAHKQVKNMSNLMKENVAFAATGKIATSTRWDRIFMYRKNANILEPRHKDHFSVPMLRVVPTSDITIQ